VPIRKICADKNLRRVRTAVPGKPRGTYAGKIPVSADASCAMLRRNRLADKQLQTPIAIPTPAIVSFQRPNSGTTAHDSFRSDRVYGLSITST